MEVDRQTAVLQWRDGRVVRVSQQEGWQCEDESLREVLNLGWSTGARAPMRRDAFASLVHEVAKIFSADLIEFSDRIVNAEVAEAANRAA
jgi:hypothetical protein